MFSGGYNLLSFLYDLHFPIAITVFVNQIIFQASTMNHKPKQNINVFRPEPQAKLNSLFQRNF